MGSRGKHIRTDAERSDGGRTSGLVPAIIVVVVLALVAAGGAAFFAFGPPSKAKATSQDSPSPSVPDDDAPGSTAAPSTTAPVSGAAAIVAENAKPGSDAWRITTPSKGTIEAYANTTSATRGDQVTLYVSTASPQFQVEAFRMGYYGGKRGRLVWSSGPQPAKKQAAATVDPASGMAEARWEPSFRFGVGQDWTPGTYLLKLSSTAGNSTYVFLVVRDDTSTADLAIVDAVTTWQAYNKWGGCSLYECTTSGPNKRAVVVSFDRPLTEFGDGAGDFLGIELPLIAFAEEQGLDVTYLTNLDVHERPELLKKHRGVVSLGHDEYYSLAMRNAMESARDAGVNLAFMGANAMYRNIRLEPSPVGPFRRMVNWRSTKDPAMNDPNLRGQTTVEWRSPPLSRPEGAVVGVMYECAPTKGDLVIADASAWIFAGTGLKNGDVLGGLVGDEYDRWFPSSPNNLQILAHSPVNCRKANSFADMSYYAAASGAGVFASGTNDFICGLDNSCGAPGVSDKIRPMTKTLLTAFAQPKAGAAHPSTSNVGTIYPGKQPTPTTAPGDEKK